MARKALYVKRHLDQYVTRSNVKKALSDWYGPSQQQRKAQRMAAFHANAMQSSLVQSALAQIAQNNLQGTGMGFGGGLQGGTLPTVVGNNAGNSTWVYVGNASTVQTSTSTCVSPTIYLGGIAGSQQLMQDPNPSPMDYHHVHIPDGVERIIHMPDGTKIEVDANGCFKILDQDAKVTYRANRIRDFNKFLNVSDRLEEFIAFCGEHGVRSGELMKLPLDLFIGWLCVKAAEADQEPAPDNVKLIPDLRRHAATPKCVSCGKFISPARKAARIEFCRPRCFERHYQRITAPGAPGSSPALLSHARAADSASRHPGSPSAQPSDLILEAG